MAQDFIPALSPQSTLTKNTRNYACQICRPPREICERCRTSAEVAMPPKYVKANLVAPSAQETWTRIILARYQWS